MPGFIRRKCLPAIVVLMLLTATHAETSEQAKALDRKWAEATTHADVVALDQILSEDLTYTHSSGRAQSKDEFIASVRSKELQYHSIEFESANVRLYGNIALISSHVRIQVTAGGHDQSVHACFLHVWAKKNGRWQMVAHQATKIE
jgi:ketosteroid isomerase-like protein